VRLATHLQAGEPRLAVVAGDALIDVERGYAALLRARGEVAAERLAAAGAPSDVVRFLALGARAIAAAREAVDHALALDPAVARAELIRSALHEARLLPPVPRPPKIVCVARNYREHAAEAGLAVSEIPILFARFAATLVAPGEPIVRPSVSDQLDWEGELAVVIGTGGHRITAADAARHVAGYSLFNDATVRDYQFRVTQYTGGKNFSGSAPFGPFLVLADELPDPGALELTTTLNGEVVQRARTSEMIFDVPTIVEHVSEFVALEPGDVIAMGTPAGVGFKRNPPRFLVPGDVVEVAIPELGVLSNPVVAEEEVAPR